MREKAMNKKSKAKALTVFLSAGMIIVLMIMLSTLIIPTQKTAEIVGKNTFDQTYTQADGSVVNYFASGDEYFHYVHDEDGFILSEKDGYVYYAREEGGKPVPTSVRYDGESGDAARLEKMSFADIDFETNPDLISTYPMNDSSLYQSAAASRPIVNIVIVIFFSDETPSVNETLLDERLNGADDSLRSYYQALSYGSILVNNIIPVDNDAVYVYQDPNSRNYYSKNMTATTRQNREKKLLNDAVNSCKTYFNLAGLDTDIDDDGFVDAVNFLVSGSPDGWGELLWPHSWNLDEISSGLGAEIGDCKVGKYSFNFLGELTVGLLCHEFAHVLGLEDYYHHPNVDNHCAVADWDLMHFEGDTPQFINSYVRDKYLNVLGQGQIATVDYNGTYTLKPVTLTSKNEIIAYRINSPLRTDEYFMVEYRNNGVTMYDSTLPGSGLIVYRVCTRVIGNYEATKNDPAHPDEVYIFRPLIYKSGGDLEKTSSRNNLRSAYLSKNNSYFSSVGQSIDDNNDKYNNRNIYFTDGTNSGIRIVAGDQNDGQISFSVSLSGNDNVPDDFFDDVITVGKDANGNDVSSVVNDSFSGVFSVFSVTDFAIENLKTAYASLYNADGKKMANMTLNKEAFSTSYLQGFRSFNMNFIVNDKGNAFNNVFYECDWIDMSLPPVKMEFSVIDSDNDAYLFADVNVAQTTSWESVMLTHIAHKSAVYASKIVTLTTSANGRLNVVTSNESVTQKTYNGVITAAAGNTHLLFVTSDMRVAAVDFGLSDSTEKLNVSSWQSIIKVAAGDDVSYGLGLNGEVRTAGGTPSLTSAVSAWSKIIDISAGKNTVVGVYDNGKAIGVGGNTEVLNIVREWTDIVGVAVGDNFVAGLKRNGNVVIAGSLDGGAVVAGWRNVKKISAGTDFLVGLKADGTVVGAGSNTYSQLLFNSYSDIVDIAAGMYHTVLLREDGVVQYSGVNTNGTIDYDNSQTGNLIYYEQGTYVNAEDVILPYTAKTVKKGDVFTMETTVVPQNSSYKKVSYSSDNPTVLSVSASGVFTALAGGTATVTVTHKGNSALSKQVVFTVIEPIQTEVIMAVGYDHSVILNDSGTVSASGDNSYGQLDVNGWGNIIFVAAGGNSTVGITENNAVVVVGALSSLQSEVSGWNDIVSVAVSEKNIVGINVNGKAYAAGDNTYNQVSSVNQFWTSGVESVSLSSTHVVGLNEDGSVRAVGKNDSSQVTGASGKWYGIKKVVAGEGFSLGLSSDGTLYSAGKSNLFDLSQLRIYEGIVDFAVGENNICLVRYNGNVVVLGGNEFLQQDVAEITEVARCAVGKGHILVLKYDGAVEGRGKNGDRRCELPAVNPIPKVNLETVVFAFQPAAVRVGSSLKLTTVVTPYNAYYRDFVYGLNPGGENYLSVNENGVVTGIAPNNNVTVNLSYALGFWDKGVWTQTGRATASISVCVYLTPTAIEVTPPTRRVYSIGDKLDLSGGKLRLTIGASERYEMKLLPDMISNFDTVTQTVSPVNEKTTVNVGYEGLTASFTIVVVNTISGVYLDTLPQKTSYIYGDEPDFSGARLRVEKISGTVTEIDALSAFINRGDVSYSGPLDEGKINILGTQTINLVYHEQYSVTIDDVTTQFDNYFYEQFEIAVYDDLERLDVIPPAETLGFGEGLEESVSITVTMKSGQTVEVAYDEERNNNEEYNLTVTNFDPKIFGKQTIRVDYFDKNYNKGISATGIEVTVADTVESIAVTSLMLLLESATPDGSDYQNYGVVYDGRKNPELSITAAVTFASGYVENIGFINDTDPISEYLRFSFPEGLCGDEVPSGLKANKEISLIGTDSNGNDNFLKVQLMNLYCLQEITAISFVDAREGDIVPFTYKYGEMPILKVRIVTKGENNLPVTIDAKLDSSLLGVDVEELNDQTVNFSILGKTATETLTFVDYIVDLRLPADNTIKIEYGNPLTLEVYMIMASGAEFLATEYTVGGFISEEVGLQTARISVSGFDSSRNIVVEVINTVISIVVKTFPRTTYEVHDPLDMTNFAITVYYKDKTTEVIRYQGNEVGFSVEGFKKDEVGTHTVTVTYKPTGHQFRFNCIVENRIIGVRVDSSKSKSSYVYGEALSITLIVEYEDGRTMAVTDGFTDDFNSEDIGTRYVNITYFGEYSTLFQVNVIDAPQSIRLKPMADVNTRYKYGQTLNVEGVTLVYVTKKGASGETKLSDFDKSCFSGFNSTPEKEGLQVVTFTHPIESLNLSLTFNVYFMSKGSSDYLTKSTEATKVSSVDKTNSRVFFNQKVTYADVKKELSSYLNLRVKNSGGVTLQDGYDDDKVISSDYTIELFNEEEVKIEIFKIYVMGDCDNDGEFTADDIPHMALLLAQKTINANLYCDANNDGKYDILDLTIWVAKVEGK